MKKFLCYLLCLISIPLFAQKGISLEKLPKEAAEFMTTNFQESVVEKIEVKNSTLESKVYKVILKNGAEILFNAKGVWTVIDYQDNAVPDKLIMKEILDYVNSHYKGDLITQIAQTKGEYNIELQSDVELLFDKKGNFLKFNN